MYKFGILCAGIISGCSSSADKVGANAKPEAVMPLMVEGVVIQHDELEDRLLTSGSLTADESVQLTAEVSARILSIHFREGAQVAKGALLIKLEDAEWAAQASKTEQQKKLAEIQYQRAVQLFEIEGISKEDLDRSLAEWKTLQAEADYWQAQLNKTNIKAPFDGVVGLRTISPGAVVQPNTPLVSIVKIQPIKIDFNLPEKYVGSIRKGQSIQFRTTQSTTWVSAQIEAIEPLIQLQTRSVLVRALHPNADRTLIPGSYAEVEIILQRSDASFLIPPLAIMPDLSGQKVYVVREGKATPLQVQTGLRKSDAIEVVEGLKLGDTLLTTGMLQLRPGMPVEVKLSKRTMSNQGEKP